MKNDFLVKNLVIFAFAFLIIGFTSCKSNEEKKEEVSIQEESVKKEAPFFKVSLAQWSIHKKIIDEGMNPFDFAQISKSWGFDGLEYVSQLYKNEIEKMGLSAVIDSLKIKSDEYGIENVLIMIDGEGDLASPDESKRNEAVEKHKKWVDAAETLGCHSVRVNLFGTNDAKLWVETATDGLSKLSDYAATKNINVLVENHGWLSSDIPVLMEVINKVGKSNCGTLPDFGNWCIKRNEGERWGECLEEYPDKYIGVELMMQAAKGVSAKSYDFDTNGNETTIDFVKMLQIVKDAGYTSYIGVEYEGDRLSEEEGSIATRKLLLSVAKQLN